MTRRALILCAGVALLATHPSAADSITIDGKTYDNVYIRTGSTFYYIQVPADGSTISVSPSAAKISDLVITPNEDERDRLLEAWKAKRHEMGRETPRMMTHDQWRTVVRNSMPEKEPEVPSEEVTQLTNRPRKLARRARGRKVFVNGQGVGIMTNRPELFRGNDEYAEVIIHYEPIEVPETLRQDPVQDPLQDLVQDPVQDPGQEQLPASNIDDIVQYYARHYELAPELIYAVIRVESNGNPYAVSSAGARGLMQLMPGTAAEMGVKRIFDPAENIAGGSQYLAKLLKLFPGNTTLALAGYNAGPGNVKKYNGVPPFKETQNYVRLVQRYHRQYRRNGPPKFAVAAVQEIDPGYLPPDSDEYYRIQMFNGLTVPAEGVVDNDPYYDYVFKGRARKILKIHVRAIFEPS